jgi:hypothetical protein
MQKHDMCHEQSMIERAKDHVIRTQFWQRDLARMKKIAPPVLMTAKLVMREKEKMSCDSRERHGPFPE